MRGLTTLEDLWGVVGVAPYLGAGKSVAAGGGWALSFRVLCSVLFCDAVRCDAVLLCSALLCSAPSFPPFLLPSLALLLPMRYNAMQPQPHSLPLSTDISGAMDTFERVELLGRFLTICVAKPTFASCVVMARVLFDLAFARVETTIDLENDRHLEFCASAARLFAEVLEIAEEEIPQKAAAKRHAYIVETLGKRGLEPPSGGGYAVRGEHGFREQGG